MEAIDVVRSKYIKDMIAKGMRSNSRGMMDFRNVALKTEVMPNAEGSAQVDLGATRVLAGIKMVVEEPMHDTPDHGNLMVSAELLPLASPDFETGPPKPESIELARVVDRGIRAAECINTEELFIEESKVWGVYIDIYVLNYSGNLFDASSIAAMAALSSTKMPKYEDGKAIWSERKQKLKINNTITSSTFAKINDKILLDPDKDEENSADARITIITDGKAIRAMQKGLSGSFKIEEIDKMIDVSLDNDKLIKEVIQRSLM